ncbi:MAG TPA: Hsp20/alpha crystallin family protein [Rubrivivax sp.]|nr:Hsp20/alpha crystallin family protein [Rubrivivax sp.]
MFIVPITRDSRAFARAARFVLSSENATRSPALDLAESNLAYTARLEVPGVGKEDIKVIVEGRRVTVQGQGSADAQDGGQTDAAKAESGSDDRIVHRERCATRYARSFTLPAEVDHAQSQAKLENGVLTLTLPKRGARAPVHVTVN